MVYRNSYLKKELRQSYMGYQIGLRRQMAFALFLGGITFALFFLFQTMEDSVLSDAAPQIMQPSFFSTAFIYIHTAFFCIAAFYMVKYDSLFFSEIRRNAWYLLVQMRYHPQVMIFDKLAALLYSAFMVYSVGFLFTVFLTFLLRYTFVFAYLPTLYLSGLIDLALLCQLCLTLSLFVRTVTNARYGILICAAGIEILKTALGYYTVISDRVQTQQIHVLFDFSRSLYLPVAAGLFVLCAVICVIRAGNLAKYYSLSDEMRSAEPVAGTRLMYIDKKTGRRIPVYDTAKAARHTKIVDAAATAALVLFIFVTLAFNIFVIMISATSRGSEVSIQGTIPYVFKSDTMEPAIMHNDLAFFRKIDLQQPIHVGDILLFVQDNTAYVERVISFSGDGFIVDIDNYPEMSQPEFMKKAVTRSEIHGIYSGRSRWLGALILFANSIFGRVVLLVIPAILLYYHRQIAESLQKKK